MRIVKLIENTTFESFADIQEEERDGEIFYFSPNRKRSGTVIYVTGAFNEAPDALLALGSEDGEHFTLCYHDGFKEFEDTWKKALMAALKERGL